MVSMISDEVRAAIAKYDQSHILKYYDEGKLSKEEQSMFEQQVLNRIGVVTNLGFLNWFWAPS